MSLRDIDRYFLEKEEPVKSCMQALRQYISHYDKHVKEYWRYKVPLYKHQERMFCHLWTDKKTSHPYIAFAEGRHMDHPMLEQGNRTRMKVLPIDPHHDLPIELLDEIFALAVAAYGK